MSGEAMLSILLATGSFVFLGWWFLYREPQYTLFSWAVLIVLISDILVVTSMLVIS